MALSPSPRKAALELAGRSPRVMGAMQELADAENDARNARLAVVAAIQEEARCRATAKKATDELNRKRKRVEDVQNDENDESVDLPS